MVRHFLPHSASDSDPRGSSASPLGPGRPGTGQPCRPPLTTRSPHAHRKDDAAGQWGGGELTETSRPSASSARTPVVLRRPRRPRRRRRRHPAGPRAGPCSDSHRRPGESSAADGTATPLPTPLLAAGGAARVVASAEGGGEGDAGCRTAAPAPRSPSRWWTPALSQSSAAASSPRSCSPLARLFRRMATSGWSGRWTCWAMASARSTSGRAAGGGPQVISTPEDGQALATAGCTAVRAGARYLLALVSW